MTPKALLAAYRGIPRDHALPEMELAALVRDSRDIEDPAAALADLQGLSPREGWVQFQSHVAVIDPGRVLAPEPAWGALLAAECVDAGGRSIQMRRNGSGGLRLVVAERVDPDTPGAETCLADRICHLTTDRVTTGTVQVHRRYWRVDGVLGVVPMFAAFEGFAGKEEDRI